MEDGRRVTVMTRQEKVTMKGGGRVFVRRAVSSDEEEDNENEEEKKEEEEEEEEEQAQPASSRSREEYTHDVKVSKNIQNVKASKNKDIPVPEVVPISQTPEKKGKGKTIAKISASKVGATPKTKSPVKAATMKTPQAGNSADEIRIDLDKFHVTTPPVEDDHDAEWEDVQTSSSEESCSIPMKVKMVVRNEIELGEPSDSEDYQNYERDIKDKKDNYRDDFAQEAVDTISISSSDEDMEGSDDSEISVEDEEEDEEDTDSEEDTNSYSGRNAKHNHGSNIAQIGADTGDDSDISDDDMIVDFLKVEQRRVSFLASLMAPSIPRVMI